MSKLFLGADQHKGHANVLKYCYRKEFMSKEEIEIMETHDEQKINKLKISIESLKRMNDGIDNRHNERVKPEDTFIHVGDFCFKNSKGGKLGEGQLTTADEYASRMNGHKIFIKGSHDNNNSCNTKVHRLILNLAGLYIDIVHDPRDIIYEDERYYYPLHIIGHVHNAYRTKEVVSPSGKPSLMINVGVDLNNFRPYSFDEVIAIFHKWKVNHPRRKEINCWISESKNRPIYIKEQ